MLSAPFRHFFYNSGWQVLETRKSTSENTGPEDLQPEYQYVWSARYIDAAILRDKNTDTDGLCDDQRLYYLTDANMNVTCLVGTDGAALERYLYDPYGRFAVYTGAWGWRSAPAYDNSILYCGYYRDTETGLYHVRNRYYHPMLGTWITRDPAAYVDGMSVYNVVRDNPMVYLDPWGLKCCGDRNYDQKTACCETAFGRKWPMEKVAVYVVNRGGPPGHQQGLAGSAEWTGGHTDLVAPGFGPLDMVGFYGDSRNVNQMPRGSTEALAIGLTPMPGVLNTTLDDWMYGVTARPGYLMGPDSSAPLRSWICKIMVCPSQWAKRKQRGHATFPWQKYAGRHSVGLPMTARASVGRDALSRHEQERAVHRRGDVAGQEHGHGSPLDPDSSGRAVRRRTAVLPAHATEMSIGTCGMFPRARREVGVMSLKVQSPWTGDTVNSGARKVGVLILSSIAAVTVAASCGQDRSTMSYPPVCPYYVAYMHAGKLVVKEDPTSNRWIYYSYSSRANGFPYDIAGDAVCIAYTRTDRNAEGEWIESVEVEELPSHRLHSLRGFEAQSVRLSPSADVVAFLGLDGSMLKGWSRKGLFVWNWKTNALTHVTPDVKQLQYGERPAAISWVGENRLVVESGSREVVQFTADQTGERRVLAQGTNPSVSPDGARIAYQRDGSAWLLTLRTGEERPLFTVSPFWDSGVIWAPDSQCIAYVRDLEDAGSWGLFVMTLTDYQEFLVARVDGWQRFLSFVKKQSLRAFAPE